MSFRGDASKGPENAVDEAADRDPETTPWTARRARVTTLKSMESVQADPPEPTQPVVALEYISEPASVVSTPDTRPPIAYSAAPSQEPALEAAPPKVSARTRHLPRGWPVVATLAVVIGGVAYVAIPETVQPREASTSTPTTAPSSHPRLLTLRVHATISPAGATATLDGKPLDSGGAIDQKLELACPRGHHELHVEARNHRAVTKRLPCAGTVVLDVALDEMR